MSASTHPWPGLSGAVKFAEDQGWVPRAWARAIQTEAYSRTPMLTLLRSGGRVLLAGAPIACDYCRRPIGERATCDGCGAPVA